jgi:hypothetical protein
MGPEYREVGTRTIAAHQIEIRQPIDAIIKPLLAGIIIIFVIFSHPCIEADPVSFFRVEPRECLSHIGPNVVYGHYHATGDMKEHILKANCRLCSSIRHLSQAKGINCGRKRILAAEKDL